MESIQALLDAGMMGLTGDPGAPAGASENDIVLVPDRIEPRFPWVSCPVHGAPGGRAATPEGLTSRQQLVKMGVTDAEILACAWDLVPVPACLEDRAGQGGLLVAGFLSVFLIRRARRRPRWLAGLVAGTERDIA